MRSALVLSLFLVGMGCNRTNDEAGKASDDARKPDIHAARPEVTEPDNTGKNERDQKPSAVTPEDQGNNEADLKITQQIRQDVMKLDGVSMDAKNVKIITSGGVVTLRGPVESAKEKSEIARLAQNAIGVTRVDNQLEVESSANDSGSDTSKHSGATRSSSMSGSNSNTGKLNGSTSGSNANRTGAADRTGGSNRVGTSSGTRGTGSGAR